MCVCVWFVQVLNVSQLLRSNYLWSLSCQRSGVLMLLLLLHGIYISFFFGFVVHFQENLCIILSTQFLENRTTRKLKMKSWAKWLQSPHFLSENGISLFFTTINFNFDQIKVHFFPNYFIVFMTVRSTKIGVSDFLGNER